MGMMDAAVQPAGLGLLLSSAGDLGTSSLDLAYVAVAAAAAVGAPLVAYSSRGKGLSMLGRAAAAAAGPMAAYALQPQSFAASALAPAVASSEVASGEEAHRLLADIKAVLGLYHPFSLAKMLAKNVIVQLMMRFNKYMLDYMDHEQEALQADAEGRDPPPPPPLPDMKPPLDRGLFAFARELAVHTLRRTYERVALRRLGATKAGALLRDSKLWIRDVLAVKHASSPLRRRFVAYQFATLHSCALHYAADATVSVATHVVRVARRKDLSSGRKAVLMARGAVVQTLRCSVILIGISIGAALGSLVRPGMGTMAGQLLTEIGLGIALGHIVESLME